MIDNQDIISLTSVQKEKCRSSFQKLNLKSLFCPSPPHNVLAQIKILSIFEMFKNNNMIMLLI